MENTFKSSSTCLIVPERKKKVKERRETEREKIIRAAMKEKFPVLKNKSLLYGSIQADCAVITNHPNLNGLKPQRCVFSFQLPIYWLLSVTGQQWALLVVVTLRLRLAGMLPITVAERKRKLSGSHINGSMVQPRSDMYSPVMAQNSSHGLTQTLRSQEVQSEHMTGTIQ